MSVTYTPINGNAGTVSFDLVDRQTGEIFDSIASLDIIEFDEDDEESEFNEIFTNINDELIKNHAGHRKKISFSIVNAGIMGNTNLAKIFKLVQFLNIVNYDQETYRLSIQFRGSDTSGVVSDAVYFGNFKLNEISANANIGQTIPLEFRSRTTGMLDYSINAFFRYLLLQDGGYVLLQNNTGKVILQAYDIQ